MSPGGRDISFLEQAKANYAVAKGSLAKAKAQSVDAERQYQRIQSLLEGNISAQADVDTAQSNAEAAKAQVEASEASVAQTLAALHQAEVNLGYTTISSPTNGIVISRNVDVGQTAAASLQAPILFLIAEDLRKMQVDTSVAEGDVGKLLAGMKASFTVEAYLSDLFEGKVRQIRNSPQTLQNVVTYDAVIDVGNPDLKLKPGMTANATFVNAEKDDVLRVPNAALRFRPSAELIASAVGAASPADRSRPGGAGGPRGGGGETMNPIQTTKVALRALFRNKTRSFLTTLGIIIGVSAVIAMVAIGEGTKARVEKAFASMGSNLLIILPGTTTSGGSGS